MNAKRRERNEQRATSNELSKRATSKDSNQEEGEKAENHHQELHRTKPSQPPSHQFQLFPCLMSPKLQAIQPNTINSSWCRWSPGPAASRCENQWHVEYRYYGGFVVTIEEWEWERKKASKSFRIRFGHDKIRLDNADWRAGLSVGEEKWVHSKCG